MNLRPSDLPDLARTTLADPRRGLRIVLSSGPGMPFRMQALVLMAVASALLLHLGLRLSPPPAGNPLIDLLLASPFTTAIVQGVVLWVTAVLIHNVGRTWGGQGSFPDAVLTVVWLQALFVAVQAVQLVAAVLIPPVAALISLLSLGLFFWLLSHFVAELHGFASVAKTFVGVVAAMLAFSLLLTFLLALLLGPGAFANV